MFFTARSGTSKPLFSFIFKFYMNAILKNKIVLGNNVPHVFPAEDNYDPRSADEAHSLRIEAFESRNEMYLIYLPP